MNRCSKCNSREAVKRNRITAGAWGEHEFLCRPCRFDASVNVRSAQARRYQVRFLVGGQVIRKEYVAVTAGHALEQMSDDYPGAKWGEVYCLQLVRRNV